HVITIGGGTVANDFGIDLGAALQGVLQLFDHHHAATAGNDETVTVGVVGTGSFVWGFVVLGGQGTHGVEQAALAPVFFFTATGEDNILFTQLNLFNCLANTMGTGGTGRGYGVVDALDFERGGQTGGNGAAHGAGDTVGADTLDAFFT